MVEGCEGECEKVRAGLRLFVVGTGEGWMGWEVFELERGEPDEGGFGGHDLKLGLSLHIILEVDQAAVLAFKVYGVELVLW